jgi:hypothetical protein|tara:strand:- start:69208 stop:70038 length:831 start_codon:yes stop_codon:yes gene_type:complete
MKPIFTFKCWVFLFTTCIIHTISLAQVGINTTTPNGILDVNSSNAGIVLPRVSLTATNDPLPVKNPQTGAIPVGTVVYNINTTNTGSNDVYKGIYVWTGTEWYNKFTKKQAEIFKQSGPSNNGMLRTASNVDYQDIPNLGVSDNQSFTAKYSGTYKIELNLNYGGGYVKDLEPGAIDISVQKGNFKFAFDGLSSDIIIPAHTKSTLLVTRYYAIWEQYSIVRYVDLTAGTSYDFSLQFDQLPSPEFVGNGNSGDGLGYIGIPDHVPCSVEFTYIEN